MDRRTRTLVVLVVAILVAGLASFGVYRAIQQIPVREVPIAQRYAVVAKESIPVGVMLAPEQVKVTPWPADSPVPGGFTKVEDVVGRGVVASIVENEPITETKLAPRQSGAGLAPTITNGMRAVSVRVNDVIGVAGFVVPGSRVDVIVTVRNPVTMSRVVVSNIQVLAAGTKTDQQKSKDGQPMPTSVVTLLVTPQDAERLALATTEGGVVLALRNPLDVQPAGTQGVRLAGLLGAPDAPPVVERPAGRPARVVTPPPPPPPPAPKPYTVDAIRGAKRTEEIVK